MRDDPCGAEQFVRYLDFSEHCREIDFSGRQRELLRSSLARNAKKCGPDRGCLLALAEIRIETLKAIKLACEDAIPAIDLAEGKFAEKCANGMPFLRDAGRNGEVLKRLHGRAVDKRAKKRQECGQRNQGR